MNTWITRWADLRRKELISYPESFPIHGTYTALYPKEDLKSGCCSPNFQAVPGPGDYMCYIHAAELAD